MIGPFRGGRTVGATGVPGKPNLFYIGVNNGGVWKTTDAGRTWTPIFDDQPTGSIGALAVAPSDPDVIYVGSGEGLQRPDLSTGDGVYKSTDGGKTWKSVGLRDGQQISAILIDPKDPDRAFVAVLGHPFGPNKERGVYRTNDGGKTWEQVLSRDENTGAVALAFDPTQPQTVYASLFESRQGPWENGSWQGTGSGLYKSTDGGTKWRQLTKGLPGAEQKLGRIGIAVAPSDPKQLYALVDARERRGLYHSSDAGDNWERVNEESRLCGRGFDFAEVKVDPKKPDTVYVLNTSTYRSTDGGKNFTCIKGAPGGDDYHTLWINPDDSDIMLLAGDQGAAVTVNAGKTWSSWYNQPTAQFFHVITDNQFPYWVYGGQQESGSAAVCSRGPYGQITYREWHPVGAFEWDYIAPDPLNPDIVYAGKVTRFDRRTGQTERVGPEALRSGKYRYLRTAPLLFSPVDPKCLFFGANVLFKTTDGGQHWQIISLDLSREKPEVPESIGVYRTPELANQPRRGVIYTIAPSYKDADTIWAGTDDGLIHVTRDGGKNWKDVTPASITSWSKVSLMDAGHFDSDTAYAAVNRIRLDDQRPHIYRTHDGGKTWKEIVDGLPSDAPVNVVREDPVRKGLLFAGTERAVFVSFNDGNDWYPLRQNMPATSIRDLVIHDDDLVVGTHGRSFWILDDITPLRQFFRGKIESVNPGSGMIWVIGDDVIFRPQVAHRVRWNVNEDTPLPPEEPAGQNPPEGAFINYYLSNAVKDPVVLEILDGKGKVIRRFSSDDRPETLDPKNLDVPTYWIRPPQQLATSAGIHRFVWDLHYPPPPGSKDLPMTAVYRNTPPEPRGPWVLPGDYTLRLKVAGKTHEEPLTVKMDPRVKTSAEGLAKQLDLSLQCCDGMRDLDKALKDLAQIRQQAKELLGKVKDKDLKSALESLDKKAGIIEGTIPDDEEDPDADIKATGLRRLVSELTRLLQLLQVADAEPTPQVVTACADRMKAQKAELKKWNEFADNTLKKMNDRLGKADLPPINVTDR